MSSWREYKLGEVMNLFQGLAINSKTKYLLVEKSNLPLLRIKDLQENTIEIFVDEKEVPEKCVANENDLIFTRTGIVGLVFMGKKGVVHNNCFRIVPKNDDIFLKFYYYYFNRKDMREYLTGIAAGSVQPDMNHSIFKNEIIPVPPLEEQKAIAEVLSSLDDKIDLLHRQNHTLESLAQTLFRQWFIEEADEGWEVGKLPDEFDFTMGLSPKGETFNEEKIGIPMYQGNADFEFRFPKNRVYTTDPKRYAERFDTLISVRAPVGAQNMAKEKCCIGRGVASFRYKKDSSFYTYTYFKMKSLMDEIKQFNDSGTVFGSINKTDFQEMEISIPPKDLVNKYQNEVKPLDDKVIQNTFQIKTLENMRDTLLPKLMSGEVRVRYGS